MEQLLYMKENKMSNDKINLIDPTEISLRIDQAIEKLQLLQGYVWDADIYERHFLMSENILDNIDELIGEIE